MEEETEHEYASTEEVLRIAKESAERWKSAIDLLGKENWEDEY